MHQLQSIVDERPKNHLLGFGSLDPVNLGIFVLQWTNPKLIEGRIGCIHKKRKKLYLIAPITNSSGLSFSLQASETLQETGLRDSIISYGEAKNIS
jgi:hypothetical protein